MRASVRLALVLAALALLAAPPAGAVSSTFHQPILFRWQSLSAGTFDVFIVPPHHGQIFNSNGVLNGLKTSELNPFTASYLKAIEDSVKDWDRAIYAYGPAALKTGFGCTASGCSNIKKYVVGRDSIPTSTRPEVVIVADENKTFILGVAIIGARPCIVDNSMFFIVSMTYQDMFNINAQEYGHCLGLDHVNPGEDPDKLLHDPMNGSYPDDPGSTDHLHCVSNLNVKGLEETFRPVFGTGTGTNNPTLASSAYARITNCATPI